MTEAASTTPSGSTPPPGFTAPPTSGYGGSAGDPGGGKPSVGSIIMLVLGLLIATLSIAPLIGGATVAALAARQDNGGFVTSPSVPISADSYALTSPDITITSDVPQVPFDLGTIRVSASTSGTGSTQTPLFIGVASQADVAEYLDGVHYSEVREIGFAPLQTQLRDRPGNVTPDLPSSQDFWIASDSGTGTVQIERSIEQGDWAIVVMNADASLGVQTELQAGFRSDWFGPIAAGLVTTGLILLLIGVPLAVLGALGVGRRIRQDEVPTILNDYPAALTGMLSGELSRGLWLVKWLLAIPHFVVLFFLWFAFVITSVIAWFAILITGRYPRALFNFNVGVLRWNWRVGFYAYSALGTDRYPPFTLSSTDYPADFTVEYPERLSRSLLFVKSWLLALPHLLLLGAVTGTQSIRLWPADGDGGRGMAEYWNGDGWGGSEALQDGFGYVRLGGFSIVGLLVLVAAVILLFRGRYPRSIFDLVMGINRWGYRVAAYVGLFRDEYPPFRLDQGPVALPRSSSADGDTGATGS